MKKRKTIWGGIFSSLLFTTTLITTSLVVVACKGNDEGENHINKLSDFTYELTNIYDYSNKIRGTEGQDTPYVDSALAHKEGIILTGWSGKPYVIPKSDTVLVHPASEYEINGKTYPVIAYGDLAFGQEIFDDWSFITGSEYQYKFIMPESLILMYNSACSWFGAIPIYDLPLCVNAIEGLTGRESMYPHISVDMSACDLYRDSEDIVGFVRGIFNYNFAFQNIDKFIWPKNNDVWERIVDDMFEDAYIKCDMDLRGLKQLKTIGHWGCGRWQMPNNDLYLPETITDITWEAFNGSRFRDIYWNVVNPDDLTWNKYEIDPGAAYQEICAAIDSFVQAHPEWSVLKWTEPFIKIALDEFAASQADRDKYVLGNLEFKNLYISNEALNTDVSKWQEYFSSNGDDTYSYGVALPEIFWALGMADCPYTSSVGNIIAQQS
ncbi:MAG: hypothetical protein LBJ97_01765 [Mycoplasmataceae bacterium]|nr:hypothetical protein [Mycoplasmataceae bacterium]